MYLGLLLPLNVSVPLFPAYLRHMRAIRFLLLFRRGPVNGYFHHSQSVKGQLEGRHQRLLHRG